MSRQQQLIHRINKVTYLGNLCRRENNHLKAKQADYIVQGISGQLQQLLSL